MKPEQRIIDRDFTSYYGFFETHSDALRRCPPPEEKRNRELRDAAAAVVLALKNYREIIDQPYK
jgi:hypothetical protein